jgi:hypothetical protein
MKRIYLILCLWSLYACKNSTTSNGGHSRVSSSQGIEKLYLKPEDVPKHIGEEVEVKATIESTYFKERENPYPTYLDVRRNYDENPFAIIIPYAAREMFPPHQTYRGKTVIVRGRVDTYDPWPYDNLVEQKSCIFIRTQDQIQIIE